MCSLYNNTKYSCASRSVHLTRFRMQGDRAAHPITSVLGTERIHFHGSHHKPYCCLIDNVDLQRTSLWCERVDLWRALLRDWNANMDIWIVKEFVSIWEDRWWFAYWKATCKCKVIKSITWVCFVANAVVVAHSKPKICVRVNISAYREENDVIGLCSEGSKCIGLQFYTKIGHTFNRSLNSNKFHSIWYIHRIKCLCTWDITWSV